MSVFQVLNWSDYCLPLAYSPGQPYRAVAEASLENFSRLGVAFMEDCLHMENGLIPEKIVCKFDHSKRHHHAGVRIHQVTLTACFCFSLLAVSLKESALKQLLEKQQSDGRRRLEAKRLSEPTEPPLSRKSSLRLERRASQEEPELPSEHQHMDGHHLHLSSCHECLELENSTILSVKFASAENISDLPDDIPDLPDDYASADDAEESVRLNASGKPPNVLVFTGGCEQQYQQIRSLLAECVDTERYTIYPLRPQTALSDPWPENTRLLVLATDQTLTPQLQLRFLSYLSQGGKVLGLSSTLCPAGLALRPRDLQKDQICRLSFTKANSAELQLSIVASGHVYERDGGSGDEVELWGEICAQDEREMAIVRVTHGADSGEAVLCQVTRCGITVTTSQLFFFFIFFSINWLN